MNHAPTHRREAFAVGAAALASALLGAAVRRPEDAYGATAPMQIEASSPSAVPLVLRGAASQDADLQQWQDSNQTVLGRVDKSGAITTRHLNMDTRSQGQTVSPELHYKGANGFWLTGIDFSNVIPSRDMTIASKVDYPNPGNVFDFLYGAHRGSKSPTLSVGNSSVDQNLALTTFTGPDSGHGDSIEPGLGGVLVRQMRGSTAPAIMVRQGWSNATQFAVWKDGSVELKDQYATRQLYIDAGAGALSAQDANTPVTFQPGLLVKAAPGAGNYTPIVRLRQDGDTQDRLRVRSDGALFWGTGADLDGETQLWRYGPGLLRSEGKLTANGGLGFGNSVAASRLGSITRRFQIFDAGGNSLGYVPLYNSIT